MSMTRKVYDSTEKKEDTTVKVVEIPIHIITHIFPLLALSWPLVSLFLCSQRVISFVIQKQYF